MVVGLKTHTIKPDDIEYGNLNAVEHLPLVFPAEDLYRSLFNPRSTTAQ